MAGEIYLGRDKYRQFDTESEAMKFAFEFPESAGTTLRHEEGRVTVYWYGPESQIDFTDPLDSDN